MSRLEELINELCPDGVEYKPLSVLADLGTGSSNTKDELDSGLYPFYVRSSIVRWSNEYEYDETAIITPGDGVGVGKIYHYVEGKYALHQRAYRIHVKDDTILIPKFLLRYMETFFAPYILGTMYKGSVASIRRPMLEKFKVPLLPLEVQREIVRILDEYTEKNERLKSELKNELKSLTEQYKYYTNKILSYDDQSLCAPLVDIAVSISSGKNKKKLEEGNYPVYGSTGIIARTNEPVYDQEQILVARVGANAGFVHLANGMYDVSDNTLIINVKKEYVLKYIYYALKNMNINQYAKGGGQPLVTASQLKKLHINVPDHEKQQKIVDLLDNYSAISIDMNRGILAEIEMCQKQYEYYRDKLLTFKEKKA